MQKAPTSHPVPPPHYAQRDECSRGHALGTWPLALPLTLTALCLQKPHNSLSFLLRGMGKGRTRARPPQGMCGALSLLLNRTLKLAPPAQVDKWLGVPWSIDEVHMRIWQSSLLKTQSPGPSSTGVTSIVTRQLPRPAALFPNTSLFLHHLPHVAHHHLLVVLLPRSFSEMPDHAKSHLFVLFS